MTELASCPFCGGTPRLFPETYSDDNPNEVIGPASINCQECSCLVHGDWSDEAIAAWNRRAPAPAETGWQMRKEANPPPNREHFDILATALSEIKATSDGHSDQPVADIIAWCLAEIAALSAPAETGRLEKALADLQAARDAARYAPGDHPIVPLKLHDFLEAFDAITRAALTEEKP